MALRSGPAPVEAASTPRRGRREPLVTGLGGALIALEAVVVLLIVGHGDFFADDFINFDQAKASPLDWHYLSASVFGHFIPLFRLTNWLVVRVAPYRHWLIALLSALVYLGLLTSVLRVLRYLFAPQRTAPMVLTLWLGTSPILLASLLWWSNGLSALTTAWLDVVAIDAFLRYRDTARRRQLFVSVVAFSIGLGFFDSMAILVVELFLLSYLVLAASLRPGALLRALWRDRFMWACYLVPLGLDFGYRFANAHTYALPPAPRPSAVLDYIGIAVGEAFLPASAGLSYQGRLLLASRPLTVSLCALLAGVIVVWSILRSRRSWRAWVFFAVSALLVLVVTAIARVGVFGPGLGLDYDDLSMLPPLLVITIGLCFGQNPPRNPTMAPVPKSATTPGRTIFRLTRIAAPAVVAGLYLVLLVPSTSLVATSSGAFAARSFFDNFARSLALVSSKTKAFSLYDQAVPDWLVPSVFAPYDKDSLTIGELFQGLNFRASTGSLYLIGANGTMLQAPFVESGEVALGVGSTKGCVLLDRSRRAIERAFRPNGALSATMLRVEYDSASRTRLHVVLRRKRGEPEEVLNAEAALAKGRGAVYLDLPPERFERVLLVVPRSASVCVASVAAGMPVVEGT